MNKKKSQTFDFSLPIVSSILMLLSFIFFSFYYSFPIYSLVPRHKFKKKRKGKYVCIL